MSMRLWERLDERTRTDMRRCSFCRVGDGEPRRVYVCEYHDGDETALDVHCSADPLKLPAGPVDGGEE
jgi:hypothetical protein